MTDEEYIKTFNVCGHKVDLGLDDYGQCFFIEYEKDGQKKGLGLGSYNDEYMEEIYGLFDPVYRDLSFRSRLIKAGVKYWLSNSDDTPNVKNHKKGDKIEWTEEDSKLLDKYKELFQNEYRGDKNKE